MFLFIPYSDVNPRERLPIVNYCLIGSNIAIFIYMVLLQDRAEAFARTWSVIPGSWTFVTMFSSMFLHAGWEHLAGNMLFLWIAGDNVEDRCGRVVYLVFYVAAGLAASAIHILSATPAMMNVPTLGASGAISGVLGAYIILFPGARIRFFYWVVFIVGTVSLYAWFAIGAWFGLQMLFVMGDDPDRMGGVAYWAHIGGFAFGVGVLFLLRVTGIIRGGTQPLPEVHDP